ncbi:MAG: PAS domain S-box protein [Ignavibacteria bacterium]|nr:PAS domain S-box protein [Ignavibacteria bacterium]
MKKPAKIKNKYSSSYFPKILILVIFIFFLTITALIYLYYTSQKNVIKSEVDENLIAISELKSNHIQNWLSERKNDALNTVKNKFFINSVYELINNPINKPNNDLLNILEHLSKKGFTIIRILDTKLETLISFPENTKEIGNFVKNEISEIINSPFEKIYITDIRHYENTDSLHFDIIAPIFKGDNYPFAILVLEINPDEFLFPYIDQWPSSSKTSECLLVERLGNEVVNINKVKHIKSKPLSLRIPLTEKDNISVKAINGERGIVEGTDYRKVPVIGVIKAIEETNWFLIDKTDEAEIYGPIKKFTTLFTIFLGLTIIIVVIFILLLFIRTKYLHKIQSLHLLEEKEALQNHYQAIIKNANEVFILTTIEGKILEVNDKAIQTYGYTKEEMLELNIKDLRAPEFRKELEELFDKIKIEKSKILETKHIKKDGTIFPVEASLRLIEIEDNSYIQAIIRDITDRKIAELKINHLNRVYALLSKINEAIIRTKDKDELIKKVCKIATEVGKYKYASFGIFDEKEDKIIIKSFNGEDSNIIGTIEKFLSSDLKEITPDYRAIKQKEILIYDSNADNVGYKKFYDEISKFGIKSCISIPIINNNIPFGALTLYSNEFKFFTDDEIELLKEVASDISFAIKTIDTELEKEKVFHELENSENKFKIIFNNANDAMLLLDFDIIIDCNKRAVEMFKMKQEELLGKKPYELSPEKQLDGQSSKEKAINYIKSALDNNPQSFEWIHSRSDGSEFTAEINLNKITIQNKPYILVIARDITKRKIFEGELLQAKQKAEEMNRLKSIFLANMSHELRTPMTGIIGFAEVLYNSVQDEKQKELVEIILKGSKRLTNTLNLILDLSKIEADKVELKLEPIKISSVLLDIALLYQIQATRKNLNLRTEIHDDVYASLDRLTLEKIISNLVQNAITFTNKGEIILSLERESTIDGNYAVIKVKDTGIGIPMNKQKTVFEPFRQVSEGYDRFYEGVGLGLTITKKYTELMGGKITLESEVGIGSTFIIKFPEIPPPVRKDNYETEKLSSEIGETKYKFHPSKKVLLVEDDEESIITIKYTLKDICNIDAVLNGYDAISLAKKETYHLILMDIGLKELDGIQTTKELRKLEKYKNTPIVALTAFAMIGDKERFLEAGCSHYISKPFSTNDLRKLVSDLLNN